MSDTIKALTEAVRGRVITPPDSDCDDARVVYNAMHDRKPRAVTQCVDSADVMAAVAAGRDGGSTWRFVVAAPFNFLESRTLAREDLYEKSCSEKLCSCCCDYTRCQRSRAGARERSLG